MSADDTGDENEGSESTGGAESANPKDELFEAIDHFKKAANLFFDRAAKDPTLKSATNEAERVIKKLGDTAEPLAKQLTSELGKLTKRLSDVVQETASGGKKKSAPPPSDEET